MSLWLLWSLSLHSMYVVIRTLYSALLLTSWQRVRDLLNVITHSSYFLPVVLFTASMWIAAYHVLIAFHLAPLIVTGCPWSYVVHTGIPCTDRYRPWAWSISLDKPNRLAAFWHQLCQCYHRKDCHSDKQQRNWRSKFQWSYDIPSKLFHWRPLMPKPVVSQHSTQHLIIYIFLHLMHCTINKRYLSLNPAGASSNHRQAFVWVQEDSARVACLGQHCYDGETPVDPG